MMFTCLFWWSVTLVPHNKKDFGSNPRVAKGLSVQSWHFLPVSEWVLSKNMQIRAYICKLLWIKVSAK